MFATHPFCFMFLREASVAVNIFPLRSAANRFDETQVIVLTYFFVFVQAKNHSSRTLYHKNRFCQGIYRFLHIFVDILQSQSRKFISFSKNHLVLALNFKNRGCSASNKAFLYKKIKPYLFPKYPQFSCKHGRPHRGCLPSTWHRTPFDFQEAI